MTQSLTWISGPPAAGKSSLAAELIARSEMGIVIPVDDIREWVKSGQASPSPWTAETERQYRLGEEAACDVALRYYRAGFSVIIDACRSPKRIDQVLENCIPGVPVTKVLLLPELVENLRRAHTRTNKDFDPHFLDEIISATHCFYQRDLPTDWSQLDNTGLTIPEEIDRILRIQENPRSQVS